MVQKMEQVQFVESKQGNLAALYLDERFSGQRDCKENRLASSCGGPSQNLKAGIKDHRKEKH
jgi:hypothetical protein